MNIFIKIRVDLFGFAMIKGYHFLLYIYKLLPTKEKYKVLRLLKSYKFQCYKFYILLLAINKFYKDLKNFI
jgi:hypothetical protein